MSFIIPPQRTTIKGFFSFIGIAIAFLLLCWLLFYLDGIF